MKQSAAFVPVPEKPLGESAVGTSTTKSHLEKVGKNNAQPIPRVAAIHDLAGFARTSLTAAIPILSSMGIQATPLPTAILSTQTVGYNDFTLLDLTGRHGPGS